MNGQKRWENQIIRYADEDPESLLANPANFRVHPRNQQLALSGTLDEIGWIAPVIVNDVTQHVIDGHLRVSLAISKGEPTVPVAYVSLSPEAEKLALATFDPLSAMAATDAEQLSALLQEVSTGDAAVQAMLDGLATNAGIVPGEVVAPDDFGEYGDDLETQYQCPKCAYEWSGKPK